MPQVVASGGLEGVEFAYVDIDREPSLGTKLSRHNTIPQLIRYEMRDGRWQSELLVGAHSVSKVISFIDASGSQQRRSGGDWFAKLGAMTRKLSAKLSP